MKDGQMKRKFVRITLHGVGSYVQPLEHLAQAIDGELADAELGAKWSLELIEMTAEEYAALPEFMGH